MTTSRTCASCGAAVGLDERFCANCGAKQPEPTSDVGKPTVLLPPLGADPNAPTVLSDAEPQPALSLPPAASASPQPVFSAGTPPPAAPTKRGFPVWAIVLLAITGLCGIGCVASLAFVGFVGQQAAQTLPTTINELGTSVAATIEAEGGLQGPTPEGGDSVLILPTPALAEPTRPAEGTAEPTPEGVGVSPAVQTQTADEIGQLFSGANEIFSDDFTDNRNNWFTGVFEEIETNTIEDGVFKAIWANRGSSYELIESQDLTSFIAEVDCLVVSGESDASCGLVFSHQQDVGYYEFELFEDYYRLLVVEGSGEPVVLAEGNPAGIVRPGDFNRLRVVKQGERIRIFANGTLLDDVTDATFAGGGVGISTNSYLDGPGAELHADNIAVWELP